MVSLVIPFVDAFDKLAPVLDNACKLAGSKDWELVLIDNGSQKPFPYKKYEKLVPKGITYIRNETNTGVLPTYKQGFEVSQGDIIAFIHSDVLIHGKDWALRVKRAFKDDRKLGLAGFFGARGIGVDGGRSYSFGNMLGKVWGGCECHEAAYWHHGEPCWATVTPAAILDGLAMIFRRNTLYELVERTDAFGDNRSIFHFYDKILSLKTIQLGYHVGVIDIEIDHFSGATANASEEYKKTAAEWFKKRGLPYDKKNPDQSVYELAEKQMFDEYQQHLPMNVVGNYEYIWSNV